MKQPFDFQSLVELCRQTHEQMQRHASRAVDTSLAVRNWLFGWYIVEYEQNGADRAEYGRQVIRKLAIALKSNRATRHIDNQSQAIAFVLSGVQRNWSDSV
jgi:hypothetical protein